MSDENSLSRTNGETGVERAEQRKSFAPRTDIYETPEGTVVLAEMPGVADSAVDITLERSTLTLTGRVEPRRLEGYALAHAEYAEGDWRRSFLLSDAVDSERIQATLKDGLLRLLLPKSQPARRRIPVATR